MKSSLNFFMLGCILANRERTSSFGHKPLRRLRFRSLKYDHGWQLWNYLSSHAQNMGTRLLVLTRRTAAFGDENDTDRIFSSSIYVVDAKLMGPQSMGRPRIVSHITAIKMLRIIIFLALEIKKRLIMKIQLVKETNLCMCSVW